MYKKRFTISSDNNQNIWDNEEKCYYSSIDAEKLCDLLNDLAQEAWDNEHYHTVVLDLFKAVSKENEELKKKIEDLEFALRTELAHQRVEKEHSKYSDNVYDFQKKLEKW